MNKDGKNSAVSEVIGCILIVFIAVVISVSIYMQMLPVPIPLTEPNVHLMGYVIEDGTTIIQHMGGETLSSYEIYVHGSNGINVYKYENTPWEIGTGIPILTENNETEITVYSIYDDDSRHIVFNGILKLEEMQDEVVLPLIHPMLISSLRTDTTDEDLICYNYFIDVNASTYIYRWIVDGKSLTEMLMPFDTNTTEIAKDYSGNGYNGSIVGATWTEEGKVGGAYFFDGASDYIAVNSPSLFDDISNDDFTISVWIKSDTIADPFRTVLGVSDTENDFVLIFQKDSKIHFCTYQDGERKAVETETLVSNTWYHIAGVWDSRKKSMATYVNGTIGTEPGFEHFPMGSYKSGFVIGRRIDGSRYWLGFIDEVEIYNRALSAEQIYQIYLSTKDGCSDKRVIVSEETVLGNVWQCMVTPNDGIQDDTVIGSNILEIRTYGGG